jgi:hypothetical protein
MRPVLARLFFAASIFCCSLPASAEEAGCPVNDKEFLHQITSSGDWMDVHAVFKRNFPACADEGLYSDGYTNLVVGILAANWDDLHTLDDLAAKNDAFKQFVLRHIGISAGEDDLKRVLRSAQAACPQQSANLCKEIAKRCKAALGGNK